MSVKQGGQEMAINVINVVNAQTELPLVLWAKDTGAYTFSATALNLTTLIAYLKDATTNTLTDLRTNTPTIQLNGGQTYDGRYSVVFEDVQINRYSKCKRIEHSDLCSRGQSNCLTFK